MQIQAHVAVEENHFHPAREKFDQVVYALHSSELGGMSHVEAEEYILAEGREVMRRLLQGYLDQRSFDDAGWAVTGSDEIRRTHHRLRSVPLKSVVGEVDVSRETYGARGHASLAPLDGALNLPRQHHSFGVQKRVCAEVARGSYDEAVEALERQAGVKVAKHQAEDVAAAAAVDFDAFYEQRRQDASSSGATDPGVIVLTTDGKGIVMRPEGLREGTRKAAAEARPKLGKRLSKGEKRNRKRMALVASVYAIAPFVRRPEDIIRELRPIHEVAPPRPRPENKRVWASVEKSVEAVIDEVFQEGLRRDPQRKKPWVVLVDGNVTQLGDMLACAEHYKVAPTVIIDIIHVVEYLWKAAWVFHAEGAPEAEQWVTERFLEVLRGRAVQVAGGIRRSATRRSLDSKSREAADICADYLLKYKAYLRYDQYLAAGLPIATGVIEGACRYLVKDRMDITGARWGLKGAEAVLRLRALRASGDFDEYWTFHQEQELRRNHLAAYPNATLPVMAAPPRRSAADRHLRVVK